MKMNSWKLARALAGGLLLAMPLYFLAEWKAGRWDAFLGDVRGRERVVIDREVLLAIGVCRDDPKCAAGARANGEACARRHGRYRETFFSKNVTERELVGIDHDAFALCVKEAAGE